MIKKELDQDEKMVVSKTRNFKLLLIIIFFSFFYSCDTEYHNERYLLNSIELSNEIYDNKINQLRRFFESKFNEEPIKYKSTYEKILNIEMDITKYSKLKTVEEKRVFIEVSIIKFKELSKIDTLEFVCLNINDVILFDLIAENDFRRNLYLIYSEFYNYHHSVF